MMDTVILRDGKEYLLKQSTEELGGCNLCSFKDEPVSFCSSLAQYFPDDLKRLNYDGCQLDHHVLVENSAEGLLQYLIALETQGEDDHD